MAEYNKQRFYWIKLTDRFMTSDTVDFLMEQKDGANYVVIYQMLCLKTVNNDGCLSRSIGEMIIPYDEEKIQRDLKWFSIDTIRVAMTLYKRLGLIYEQDNGVLRITDFDNLVGSQTVSAFKKQEQLKLRGGKQGGIKVEKIPPEKDIDKEKEIKREDKDIEKERIDINIYNISDQPENSSIPTSTTYGLEEFKRDNPQIEMDDYDGTIYSMDFEGLTQRIKESSWLQKVNKFSFFCYKYKKVMAGEYKDRPRKDYYQNEEPQQEEPKRIFKTCRI